MSVPSQGAKKRGENLKHKLLDDFFSANVSFTFPFMPQVYHELDYEHKMRMIHARRCCPNPLYKTIELLTDLCVKSRLQSGHPFKRIRNTWTFVCITMESGHRGWVVSFIIMAESI